VFGGAIRIERRDPAIDNGGDADFAPRLDRQAIEELIAWKGADHTTGLERRRGSQDARLRQIERPKTSKVSVGHIDHGLIRREPDPVWRIKSIAPA